VDTKAFIRTVVLVLCALLTAPAVVWLVTTVDLETVALAGIGVFVVLVFAYLAYLLTWRFWAWFIGIVAVLLTPALLKLGALFIVGDARSAMEAWVYVYVSGAVGGLVLELLRGRGGLELPSPVPPQSSSRVSAAGPLAQRPIGNGEEAFVTSATSPPAGSDPITGSPLGGGQATTVALAPAPATYMSETASQDGAEFAAADSNRGGRAYIGFLARVTMGGIAASGLLALFRIVSGNTEPSSFTTSALRLDTLAAATLIGIVAPALWTAGQSMVESRFSFMRGAMDTAVVAVLSAEQSVKSARDAAVMKGGPDSSQFIVDAAPLRSPEFIATLAREEDPTEVGKMLLARINSSRLDVATGHSEQESQLGQALGSLETARRILRAGTLRLTRR
jgi:hypothetical protein